MDDERQGGDGFPGHYQRPTESKPVVPGERPVIPVNRLEDGRLPRNRGDLILFLGIISLFACWPLGIVAWVMGNTDLKKIRDGRMSPTGIGILKTGRFLGMLTTVLLAVSLVLLVLFAPRELPDLSGTFTKTPLPPERVAYAGEWVGNHGTTIVIRPDGTGDFRTATTTVRGGRVTINDESLSIGMLGFYKSWRIERAPKREGANWIMKLDGETFKRRAGRDLIAGMPGSASRKDRHNAGAVGSRALL
jgi:hypothetical protein